MKTKNLTSILRMGILAISCTAFLASCTTETEEVSEPLYTMGDPKNSSSQGQRCFEISEFTSQGEGITLNYEEIIWTFKNNGTVIARSPNQEWPGSWNIGHVDGDQKLFLNFPEAPPLINAVAGSWTVVNLDPDNPQFINDEGDVLQFLPTGCTGMSAELQAFNTSLVDSLWKVEEFGLQDEDVTSTYADVIFNFHPNGTVVAKRFGQQRGGQWMTSENQDGLVLTFQFQSPPQPLTILNGTWDVVSFSSTEIVLEKIDGPPGSGSFYTIELENAT